MREERKKELMNRFPAVPDKYMNVITNAHKKGSGNFVVFLTHGDELFARCYHRYYDGRVTERQRYVFAKDGCCRYGSEYDGSWRIRTEFREPVFCLRSYGYNFDNTYSVLNMEAVKKSCMKYSCIDLYSGHLLMEYLKIYCKHKNLEYLMKAGYGNYILDERTSGYWGGRLSLTYNKDINWKSNNLLKMLNLSRTEFFALKGHENLYECYIHWRKQYPKYKPEELLLLARAFGYENGTAGRFAEKTGLKPHRIARYLVENEVGNIDYSDYLDQCRQLKYNLSDTAISMPHDFETAHTRLSKIISYHHDEVVKENFRSNMAERNVLKYEQGGFIIRQPKSIDEIVEEGAVLDHCVGGYAERHALGKLHILFIRKKDKPDVPYYTMQVSITGNIIQVRGRRNCDMTKAVGRLIDSYKQYLSRIFDKERKTA